MTVSAEGVGLPKSIKVFLLVLAFLTLGCAAVETVCGRVLHLGYPYTWPLMKWETRFSDFSLYKARFAYFHSAQFFSFLGPGYYYPAPLAALHRVFYLLPSSTGSFLALLIATWLGGGLLLVRLLVRRGIGRPMAIGLVAVAAVCSYPFFFEFEQANLEWILCVLVGAGVVAFLRGRGYSAAVCFGIVGSMKIYPLVMVGLLIARRQYRQAVVAVGVCGVSTLAGLWLLCPNLAVSWANTQIGLESFRQRYVLQYEQVGFDHSLVGLMKAVSLAVHPVPLSMRALSLLVGLYLPVVAIAGVLLYFDVIRKLPVVNQVICLTVATILLPPVSYDYTLLHFYLPWALVVLAAVERWEMRGLSGALICFAVLFAPETELIWGGRSYGGQVKALALVGLFGIALVRRFPSQWDWEATTPPQTMEPFEMGHPEILGGPTLARGNGGGGPA
jgi:hypothetical protein